MGIEPTCAAWKAAVLPLNYTRSVLELNCWMPAVNLRLARGVGLGKIGGLGVESRMPIFSRASFPHSDCLALRIEAKPVL